MKRKPAQEIIDLIKDNSPRVGPMGPMARLVWDYCIAAGADPAARSSEIDEATDERRVEEPEAEERPPRTGLFRNPTVGAGEGESDVA